MTAKVVITPMVLGDLFFRNNPARLGRFISHWMFCVERNDPAYFPHPDDDNEQTHRIANELNWICEGRKGHWFMTGPEKSVVWLRKRERPVSTYVIEQVGNEVVKIGRSKDPWARLSALQTSNPQPLRMVAVLVGDVESDLHRFHAADRINGEWFRFSDRIRQSIQLLDKVEPEVGNGY